MNKKYLSVLGLLLALILTLLIYFLVKSPRKSTMNPEEIDFAVKDTTNIAKVIITAYIEGNAVSKVYLTKKMGNWWVNDEYKAQNTAIENLLQTVYAIQMQQPLHPNAIENVKKLIKKRNVHVIIQNSNGSVLKGYYIGPATPDSKGNYVILEGAENPYIAEIPGFQGYLSTRFSASPENWRDYTLWSVSLDNFQEFIFKDKNHKNLIQIKKKNDTFWINNQIFKDTTIFHKIKTNFLQCVATGIAKNTFPNAEDSLSKIPADFSLTLNNKNYLLWTNHANGAFFIVPIRTENNKTVFDGEIMLLQKLTVQRWFLSPNK